MSDWKNQLGRSVTSAQALARLLPVDEKSTDAVIRRYPMRIPPHFFSLIREPGDPLWRQAVPDGAELDEDGDSPDPLAEEAQSPVPGLIHRYPDRVVFLVSSRCAMYCRHCMRKRRVGGHDPVIPDALSAGIEYIRKTPAVTDVILSGGDPLLLDDSRLLEILSALRAINHVETLRIHTRTPGVLPQRITPDLALGLRAFHPLFVNIQFNHPDEITEESAEACARLADAGIPLGSQTVLLKGVNDDPAVMARLMKALLCIRVRPYYLHQGDLVKGTRHFRTPISKGLAILASLRGRISGIGVPSFMIDLPGGGGKIPLLPESIVEKTGRVWRIRAFDGRIIDYPVQVE